MATRIATNAIPYTERDVAEGNFDRTRAPIDRIILHTMVGTVASASARFADPSSQVCAHYGVGVDGSLTHWLEETFTGYHAGDYLMNQRSIGIEHEDLGKYNDPRPDALYATSAKLVADICAFYGFPCDHDHIKRHQDVSDKPTACPDALDTDRIIREAAALLGSPNFDSSQYVQENDDPNQIKVQIDGQWYERQALSGLLKDKAIADTDLQNTKDELARVYDLKNKLANQVTDLQGQIYSLQKQVNTQTQHVDSNVGTPAIGVDTPIPSLSQFSKRQLFNELLNRFLS